MPFRSNRNISENNKNVIFPLCKKMLIYRFECTYFVNFRRHGDLPFRIGLARDKKFNDSVKTAYYKNAVKNCSYCHVYPARAEGAQIPSHLAIRTGRSPCRRVIANSTCIQCDKLYFLAFPVFPSVKY